MSRPTPLAPAASVLRVLAALTALLTAPSASAAELHATTTGTTYWVGATPRWSSSSSGPFTSAWTDYADARFASGTYNFQRLIVTNTANIGNVTLEANARVIFAQTSGQAMNFITGTGGVATFNLADDSRIDFGSIIIAPGQGNGIVKNGNGTLTLTGGIVYGGYTHNAGNSVARNAQAFGSGPLTINGGAIGSTTNVSSPTTRVGGITIGGDFQMGISGSVGSASSTANMTFSGTGNTINLGGATRKITLGNGGSMTLGGVLSNGALTLTRNADGANGQFTLSGSNTFAGDLTVDGVKVNASTANSALGGGGVALGGTTGYDSTLNLNGLTVANAITFVDVAGFKSLTNTTANATIQSVVTNSDNTGTIRVGSGTSRTFTLAGGLGGSGSKGWLFGGTGLPGTVVLGSSSAYTGTGDTTIEGAVVQLSASQALAQNSLNLRGNAKLDLNGNVQTFKGLTSDSAAATIISTGLPGTVAVGAGDTSSSFDGSILGNNVFLEKIGQGSFALTNTGNTFNSGVTVDDGALLVSTGVLPSQPVVLSRSSSTITFDQGSSGTFAGDISGSGSLTKTGLGDVQLSGANAYTGATTVSAGRLSVNGSLGNTSVTVASGAELGGSGSIVGMLAMLAGGTLSPGNSIESLSVGAVAFDAGSTFEYEVDSSLLGSLGTAADLLVVNGNLDIASGSLLSFLDITSGSPQPFANATTFALINYSGNWNGGLFTYGGSPLADGGTFKVGSQDWEIHYNSPTGGSNYTGDYLPSSSFVTVAVVPEPSTKVVFGALVACAALLRRPRRKAGAI